MNKRCESGSTVVTNSRTVLDRGLIPDNTDILDWLIRHRCVFTINGDSYRLMSAREEKLPEETINRYNLMATSVENADNILQRTYLKRFRMPE